MARRVTTLTTAELDRVADEFEALVVRGMREAVRRSIERAYEQRVIVAANGDDEESVDPNGFIAFIQQYWAVFVATVLVPFLTNTLAGTGSTHLDGLVLTLTTALGGPQALPPRLPNFIDQPLDTERYVRAATNRLARIGDELWEDARDELIEGIDAGESIDDLANRVAESVDVAEPRARTIARTETNAAMNGVVNDTNRAVSDMFGVPGGIRKEWSSTHDLRTRPTHVAADGQVVDLDDAFTVGTARLQFPSDPTGPPGETINCRCAMLTVISDELLGGGDDDELDVDDDDLEIDDDLDGEPMTAAAQREEAMPYEVVPDHPECTGGEFGVVKSGTGELQGCHATEEDAQARVAALNVAESDDVDESAAPTGAEGDVGAFAVDEVDVVAEPEPDDRRFATWSGVLAVEGVPTGDGRQFEHGALTWAELPIPLGWMYERSHGGMPTDKVANVGMIDTIERGEGGLIVATGRIDRHTAYGWQVAMMMGTRENPGSLAGVSIDADDPDDPMQLDVEYVFPDGCAVDDAGTLLDDNDGEDMELRCMMPQLTIFKSGRIRAATLVDIPAFVEARVYLDRSPEEDELDRVDPIEEEDVLIASSYTMTLHDIPPVHWFDEPRDEPDIGAITVTDEGRIFGYLAPKHVAHRGIRDRRVEVPMKNVDYGIWMNRVTIADDGRGGFTRVATGPITMDCGHAPSTGRLTGAARRAHYDNSCSVVATARVGENARGVWIAGAVLPDVTPEQVRRMMTLQLSGDWGPHREQPGKRELAGALLVPVPGFPRRAYTTMKIRRGALASVGVPLRFAVTESRDDTTFGIKQAAHRIAKSVGRDRVSRVRELAERIGR